MPELLQYKCPCCGGAIEFDSSTQNLKCPYCDTEFDVDTLNSYDDALKCDGTDEMNWDETSASEWSDEEISGIKVYSCASCGGEIVGDDTTAATSCPYCGNPVVMQGNLSGHLRPDFVIPFKLDKAAAKEAYHRHISKRPLLPKVFKDENHIDEIKGIYVPFWLFDAEADAMIRFTATKHRSWSDAKYSYTQISHYSVVRGGTLAFEHVPADGSSKMPDDLMQSIEPYNYSEAVDFKTAYLAGFFADKYNVTSEECIEIANKRIKESTTQRFTSSVYGYSSVTEESASIRLSNTQTKYALFPVWLLNTTWNGKKHTFAMNGQTGKFVGNLPVDKKAALLWLLGLTPLCTLGVYIISLILRYFGFI